MVTTMMVTMMVAINGDEDDGDEDGGNGDDSEQMKKTTDNCCEDDVGDTYAYPKLFYDLEPLVLHSLFFPQDIARPRSAIPDQQIIPETIVTDHSRQH